MNLFRSQGVAAAALIFLLAPVAHAQNSQFLFDDNGNLTVRMAEFVAPPQIVGQPQTLLVATGDLASFSVLVANPNALSYQWRFNGMDLGGATTDALLLQKVSTNNEGEYRVVLTNPSGSITSAPAMLWIDSRGVGMPDSWQLAYFGNLTNTGTGDFDGDGVSNLQEFLDGTNPTNSNSVLYHLTVIRDGGSVVTIPDQASYTKGQSVTLTAIASSNETFHAWLGDIVTQNNTITLVMTTNKTVYAHFTPVVFEWTGPLFGDWNIATNWTPNLVPGSNDSVVINIGSTVTLNTPADCASVVLGGPDILGFSGNSNPNLTGSGKLTVHESLYWRSGSMSGSGRTVLETGAALIMDLDNEGLNLSTRTLELGGETFWTAAANLFLNNAVITNRAGAVFHAVGSGSINFSSRFDNAGTFRKSGNTGTTKFASGATFNNYGTVEIDTGTLHCDGSFTNRGAVHVSAGATHRLAGGGTCGGTFTAAATALVEWTFGGFTLNAQLNGSGLYQINAGGPVNQQLTTVTNNADIVVEHFGLLYGVLAGSGTITISNAMSWTGGTMSGSGQMIISPGATLTIASPSTATLSQTLENGGTILWTGAGDIGVTGGGVITNRAGALFHAQNAAGLGGNGRLDNAGTFRKSANTGITTIQSGMILNNFGTAEIQAGTLRLAGNGSAGSGSATGTFDAAPTTLVEWTGGTFALNAGAQLNGAGLYRINGFGATLTANTDIGVGRLDLTAGTLNGAGSVTIANAMTWSAGTMSGNGRTIIAPAATLNFSNASFVSLTGRTLENGGAALWTGAGNIEMDSGAVITNSAGALFDVQSAASFSSAFAPNRIDNAGGFRKSVSTGTTTVPGNVSFNNSGTVEIQTGTLSLSGGGTDNGSVTVSPSATLMLSGGAHTAAGSSSITGGGQLTVSSGTANLAGLVNVSGSSTFTGGTANLTGNYICTNNTVTISSGTANFNGTGEVSPAMLNLSSGTLGGSNLVTVTSQMNWTGGTMTGGGRTIIAPGATLNLAVPVRVDLTSRTLENGGTVLWTGAGTVGLSTGVITNRAGALFHVQNAAPFVPFNSPNRVDNVGTFRKSTSTGTTTLNNGVNFTNYGTVDIRSGVLAASGGYVSSSNALLNCALGGTTAGTNYGQLQVAGTVTLNGGLSVDLVNGFWPALSDSFAVLTAGTRNGAFNNFYYPSNQVTMLLSNSPNSVIVRVGALGTPPTVLFPPVLAGSNILLAWTAVSNATYRIEFNPNLNPTNWSSLPGDVTSPGNTASKQDVLTPSNRFYRVRILP